MPRPAILNLGATVIRVLIVDDSPTIRLQMRSLLARDRHMKVVGEAGDGAQALSACLALKPDVITMDLFMPDGSVRAIQQIMDEAPTPIVVVSGLASEVNYLAVLEALAAGALTVAHRPPDRMHPDFASHKRELIRAVKSVARISLARRSELSRPALQDDSAAAASPLSLVGIGASTGGPAAIMELLSALPADFAPSIALVQHMTPGFVVGMVEWLASACDLPVELAAPGMRLPWRGVRVAPDGVHLKIVDWAAEFDSGPPRGGDRPSVDLLFESMADWSPSSCAGILMSGMGQDGCAGLARLRTLGARTMVQSEETCVVFGMPGAALEMGAAEVTLGPAGLAAALQAMVRAS